MAERHFDKNTPEEYDETVDPNNPPNAVLRPRVRRAAWWLYVFPLIFIFAIVAVVSIYWMSRGDDGDDANVEAVGTAGDAGMQQPGGFEPIPRPDDTSAEIEFRGGAGASESELTSAGTVDLQDMQVVDVAGNTFWIEHEGRRVQVMAPSDAPEVRAGMRVNVSGEVEDAQGDMRIRATRLTVR